jgi:uncharacterized membrane protein
LTVHLKRVAAARRLIHLSARLSIAVVLALALSACGNDDNSTPTTPTTPVNVTETFSGVVNQNGAMTHGFSTTTSGTLSVTLTMLGPDSTQVIGMSIGTLTGTQCQTVLSNDSSTQGTVITGGVSSFGSLCVRAYDVGRITAAEPFTYEITVVHP